MLLERGCNTDELWKVITMIANQQPLSKSYRDYVLTDSRNYKNMREIYMFLIHQIMYKGT